jgi:FKBP-type peptidyl-prolyl cis-trans isomerase 2
VLCHAPLHLQAPSSVELPGRVVVIHPTSGEVTIDLNHELAGKHLTFDVTLLSLVPSEAMQ